jgi:hypothetical protein
MCPAVCWSASASVQMRDVGPEDTTASRAADCRQHETEGTVIDRIGRAITELAAQDRPDHEPTTTAPFQVG